MGQSILLIVSDPASARSVMKQVCESGDFTVEWHRKCADAARQLQSEAVGASSRAKTLSAVLLDRDSIGDRGTESLEQLLSQVPKVPILILTNQDDEHTDESPYQLPMLLKSVINHAGMRDDLLNEEERSQTILDSIGDAVLSVDVQGRVSYLNDVAQRLTGWPREEAVSSAVERVLRIIDAGTRQLIPNPTDTTIREHRVTTLPPDCILIRRDGAEAYIEDSTSPIRDRSGAVTGAVMTFRDVTAARMLSARMSYLAHHDSITDLPNRLLLWERLGEAIAMANRHGRSLALIYFDLDRFKYINDSLGHSAGDHLLKILAQRLRNCVRDSDTVSRTGGDEFAVLLPEIAHPEDAAVTARKMLEAAREKFVIDGTDVTVTGSAGVATYPDDGVDEKTLSRSADIALYHSKDSGRDRYEFFSPEMNTRVIERQTLEADLRTALDGRQFELHYQPKVDLVTGKVAGVEALIRWHHLTRGMVLPSEFIQVAEDTALIVPIGRWVLGKACRQAKAWHDGGNADLRVAVNVSAVELRANAFVSGIRSCLETTGLAPECLEIELTESLLMEDPRATAVVLGKVKDLGVSIAIDDFGTGQLSLSHLRRFPVDSLKIDQSFIRDIVGSPNDASLVEAIINLGRNLNLHVVAEGVETIDQLSLLRERKCPVGQGFYFSQAVRAPEVAILQAKAFLEPRG